MMAHPVHRRNRGPLAALGLAALLAVAPPLTQVPPPAGEPCSAAAPRDSCLHDAAEAGAMAEAIVRRQLSDPSAAFRTEDVSRTGETWTVTGCVDTRDGAGGLLRRDFTVRFTRTGGGRHRVDLCRVG